MRTRSRRAPLLAACAFALAVPLSAPAGDTQPVAVSPVAQQTIPVINGSLTTPAGRQMAEQLADLEKALVKHLKGEQPSTFAALDERRKALKARIDAAPLAPADRKVLDERLGRTASVIMRSLRLTGGGTGLDAELSKAVANAGVAPDPSAAKDPLFQIDALLGDLEKASANPANAEEIFERLNRRYGGVSGPSAAGVRVDFGAIRKTLEVTYTPDGAPGTNAAKARDLARPTPPPAQEPVAVRGEKVDFIALMAGAGQRALSEFQKRTPGAGAPDFVGERGEMLKTLQALGRKTVSSMLGDPDAFTTLDALVEHLLREEARLARSLGEPAEWPTSEEAISRRFDRIARTNPELAEFSAALWTYREFLRDGLRGAPAGTPFAAWEIPFQDGGARGGVVVAETHGKTEFIGLRVTQSDGSSVFTAFSADDKSAIRVAREKSGAKEIVRQNFDGERNVLTQITERYDANGARLEKQTYDPNSHRTELTTYSPDGKVLRRESGNSQTEEVVIQQLGGAGPRFEARISKDRREVKFTDQDTAPYRMQVDRVNPDGSIELDFRVLKDGRTLKQLTKRVQQVIKDGKVESWDVSMADLPSPGLPEKRKAQMLLLAKEILAAVGEADPSGRKTAAFADFLNFNAVADALPKDMEDPPIRLSIAPGARKVFTLIIQRANGERLVLTGFFGEKTAQPGQPAGPAYLVQNPVEFDAEWNMRNAHDAASQLRAARVAHEYLGDGTRIFREDVRKEERDAYRGGGWNPGNWVANKNEVSRYFFQRQTFSAGRANPWPTTTTWEGAETVREKAGSAPALGLAQRIVSVPGIKQTLEASNWVSNLAYTGIVNVVESNVSGDLAQLNSIATRSRNPAWARSMAGPQPDGEKEPEKFEEWTKKILAKLTPGARAILNKRVLELRPERLAGMGVNANDSPLYYEQAMGMPPSDMEAYFALSEFGAGTYGKQLARNGHGVLGAIASGGEALGQMATNPLTWAMPYAFSALGKAATSLGTKAAVAAEAGATGTSRALSLAKFGVNTFKGAVVGTIGVPFVLDTGHMVHEAIAKFGTPEGADAMGKAIVDLGFIYGMGRSMGKDLAGTKVGKRLMDRFRAKGEPVAPQPVAPEPVAAKPSPLVEPNGQLMFEFMRDQGGVKPAQPVKPAALVNAAAPAAPASPAPAVVEAVVAKGPPPGKMARMAEFVSTKWREFRQPADAFASKGGLEPLKAGDVKINTRAEANGPASAATLDAKSAEIISPSTAKPAVLEPAVVEAVSAKPAVAKAVVAKPVVETAAGGAKQGPAKTAAPRAGEQLQFEFMKGKPEPSTVKIAREPVKTSRALEFEARKSKAPLAEPQYKQLELDFGAKEAAPEAKARGAKKAAAKPGEQLEFDFMKDKVDPLRAAKQPAGAGPMEFRAKSAKAKVEKPRSVAEEAKVRAKVKPEGRPVVKEGVFRRAGKYLLASGYIGLASRVVPTPPPSYPRRHETPWKTRDITVEERAPAPPASDGPAPEETPADTPEETRSDTASAPERREATAPAAAPAANTTVNGGAPAGPGGAAGGGGDGGGPSGKGPKAPKFGGFGGGGSPGGGGGGPAGNGADGGGAAGAPETGGPAAPAPRSAGPAVSPEPPPNLLGGGPVIPVNRGPKAVPNETGARGGHSPAPSLASRFDGSRPRGAASPGWSPTPMKGVGAGDSPALPRLAARAGALAAPAAADAAPLSDRGAGAPAAYAPGAASAPGVKPEEEDFSYTYMAPARHKYELPTDRPAEKKDWQRLLALALRGAAALAIAYLIYHSDLPYLVGLTRRRRDGTYGA